MTTTAWIIVAVVVIVLLAILAIAVGLWRRSQNTISFAKDDTAETEAEPRELTQQERSGNYQAGTGFSFTTAEKAPAPTSRPSTGGAAPQAPEATAPEATAPSTPAPSTPASPAPAAEPATPAAPESRQDTETGQVGETRQDTETPAGPTDTVAPAATAAPEAEEAPASDVTPETSHEDTTVVPAPSAPTEEIAPTEGRMTRLRGRLSRSNSTVGKSVLGLLGAGDLDEEAWEEIEDTLIMADLGTDTTMRVVERLRSDIATNHVRTEAEVRALLRSALVDNLHPELDRSIRALPGEGKPAVILVVGVNGTGKTTTTGKLARVLVADGRSILLGAADTFRAAAADQLQTWGERVGAETVRGKEAADPAAVAFDAVERGIDAGVDAVLVDTAGRLHTKVGLMDQLGKVKRVVEKKAKVDEVLLVIDATTGQNGLQQARVFRDVVDITGVVLTKLDGTAKGGIVFQVQHELGVPVKLVGLGEGADDLAPFVPEAFVDALLT